MKRSVLVARGHGGRVGRQALLPHDVRDGGHRGLPLVAGRRSQQHAALLLLLLSSAAQPCITLQRGSSVRIASSLPNHIAMWHGRPCQTAGQAVNPQCSLMLPIPSSCHPCHWPGASCMASTAAVLLLECYRYKILACTLLIAWPRCCACWHSLLLADSARKHSMGSYCPAHDIWMQDRRVPC